MHRLKATLLVVFTFCLGLHAHAHNSPELATQQTVKSDSTKTVNQKKLATLGFFTLRAVKKEIDSTEPVALPVEN